VVFATALPTDFCEHAELLALRWRARLGLSERERLDPYELAELMGVPVLRMADVPSFSPEHLKVLQDDDVALSALTVIRGQHKLIVVNESHTVERQTNSITHELAHVILEHPPTSAFDALGNRMVVDRIEEEANWLSSCLLVPSTGIEAALRAHAGQAAAAAHYGVSRELMRWRCNAYGFGHRAA
jgi:Zn-dependent peptidase ImmA (M78 family)